MHAFTMEHMKENKGFVMSPFMIRVPKRSVKLKKECKGQLWIFVYLTLL
jgi:hypothetical protein